MRILNSTLAIASLLLASTAAHGANTPPAIAGTPPASVQVQKTYRFFASASDADGDVVTFSIANKPSWAWFDSNAGILGGEPQSVGTYSNIVISASDGNSSVSLPPFSITATSDAISAQPANRSPVISGAPTTSVQVQKTYRFFATASDPDGDAVQFSIANKPSWAWFDSNAGILGGEPQAAGTYANIVISATDGKATVSLPAFSITATSGTTSVVTNRPPVISGAPTTSVQVQKTYRFFATASDPDGDAVQFSIANKPSWAWFDSNAGILGGEPQATGTYANIVISATDGKATVSLPAFSITATSGTTSVVTNRPPVISGLPPSSVQVQKTYRFFATASDPDGDAVQFSIANKPSWAWFDSNAGILGGEPQAAGTYANIVISATDGKATVSLPAFSITAGNTTAVVNSPPVFNNVPAGNVTVGATYVFQPAVTDPNGDRLAFSVSNKPVWATFSTTTGYLTGAPQATNVGTYSNISISVSDGKSTVALPKFSIVVSNPVNGAPTLSGSPSTKVTAGSAYSFQPTASDPNGDVLAFSIANKPSWATFNTATGRLSGSPQGADVATYSNIVISVSDGKTATLLPAFSIAVTQISLGSASLSWTPPTQNTDGSALMDLSGYRIYFGTSASTLNQVIDVPGPGIVNYLIDRLSAGNYYFAVKAVSASGTESAMSAIGAKTIQ